MSKAVGISVLMICDAPTEDSKLMEENTVQAFNCAGVPINNMGEIKSNGVHIAYAVKTPRKTAVFPAKTIEENSFLLEKELNQFPNLRAILLMGDTAIKSINLISKRLYDTKAIPAGSTYKIRGGKFYFGKIRVFPSYLQTGKNFLIEKSKQKMVSEDIKCAFSLIDK